MKKVVRFLSSPVLMAALLIILSVAMATATFIENDFGAKVAKMKVYNSAWFEILLAILALNITARIFQLKLYKAKKLSVFLTHIAFVIMIIGGGLTRHVGYEGTMHIREGQSSNEIITQQRVLTFAFNNKVYQLKNEIEHKRSFKDEITNAGQNIKISLSQFYNNAYKKAREVENGKKIIGFVIAGNGYRGAEYLSAGSTGTYGNLKVSFEGDSVDAGFYIYEKNDSLYIRSSETLFVSSMRNDAETLITDDEAIFEEGKIYRNRNYNLVLQENFPSAEIFAMPTAIEGHKRGMRAMVFEVADEQNSTEVTLWENQWNREAVQGILGGNKFSLKYGSHIIKLPFSLHLNDFVIDRYPGSMSPSSFSSYVNLLEEGKEAQPYHIYMNNILKHEGYRFYQSSYDPDEKGTVLSVNHDQLGTGVTYLSYALLILGILLSMVNPNTFFRNTKLHEKTLGIFAALLLAATLPIHAQTNTQDIVPVDAKHAEKFGELLIQNNAGRTEPVYTYASELMRKLAREEKVLGLTPVQLFMEMNMNPGKWLDQPIIRVTNREFQRHIGISRKYASYRDFISDNGGYVLQNMSQQIYAKPPAERSKFDKAVLKTDEKVNICHGIFSGRYLKILPVPGNKDSTHWFPPGEASLLANNPQDSLFLGNIVKVYFEELEKAKVTGDYSAANEYLAGLKKFQEKNAGYELPSKNEIKLEVFYYKFNVFKKLFPVFLGLGVVYLFILLVFIVLGRKTPKWLRMLFFITILLGFVGQTLGIAIRWYISGHAPMSNGYESMIFISWVTVLAGFIYHKRSEFALTATTVIAGLTLMVANLSFMDPQITNLVPVLQSYWLTIHVSVITASYGFLALGFILGLINLILFILLSPDNKKRIVATIENLTIINHKTLIVGLYLLTIGTFLGAVWANESWGRYWGWDPKETWALISILVYTLVTHARLIPGMKGIFTFNILSMWGFSSILMTYFGVNYYLSGLHSYAGGDPVPVPTFVYYSVAVLLLITLLSAFRYGKFSNEKE